MNKKLDNYITTKYPKIFINRYSGIKNSTLSFGYEHGDGWFWLIDKLCASIQSYIDLNNQYRTEDQKISQVIADQVKEKFGVLNFYYHGGDETIHGMVRLAESMSENICEFCGSTEYVGHTIGWISTICKECYDNSDGRISQRTWIENKNIPTEFIKELRKIKLDKLKNAI